MEGGRKERGKQFHLVITLKLKCITKGFRVKVWALTVSTIGLATPKCQLKRQQQNKTEKGDLSLWPHWKNSELEAPTTWGLIANRVPDA